MENGARIYKPGDFSLGQVHEFLGAFGRHGGTPEMLQEGIQESSAMARVVTSLQNTSWAYHEARIILGRDDLITPEEISRCRNVHYSHEQLKMFVDTLPPIEKIEWCSRHGLAIIAGPPFPMYLQNIFDLDPEIFGEQNPRTWSDITEVAFSSKDKAGTNWLAIGKGVFWRSNAKSYDEQKKMLYENLRIPNAAEVVWALTTYMEVRGVLNNTNDFRTSSRHSFRKYTTGNYFSKIVVRGEIDGHINLVEALEEDADKNLGVAYALNL